MRDLLVLARFGARHPRALLALRWLSTYLAPFVSPPKGSHEGNWVGGAPYFRLCTSYLPIPKRLTLKHSRRLAFLHNRSRLSWLAPTFLCLLFLNGKVAEAQSPAKVAGEIPVLDIGDEFPYPLLENVLFAESGTLDLSEYRGRLLILDFWATWCAPCVAAFPKLMDIQDHFGSSVAILPVTYQQREEVVRFFGKSGKLKGFDLPTVTGDVLLGGYFPHESLPHHIWIDPQGKVMAVTYDHELSRENISNILQGQTKEFGYKEDLSLPFDPNLPLIAGQPHLGQKPIIYQSALTGYIPGIYSGFETIRDGEGRISKFVFTNSTIKLLFSVAFGEGRDFFPNNRILFEVSEPELLTTGKLGPALEQWAREGNLYCYELIFPDIPEPRKWSFLRSEVEKLFPRYKVEVREQEMPVLALVALGDPESIRSRGGSPASQFTGYSLNMTNTRLALLLAQLNLKFLQNDHRPVINRTGIDFPVDISLDADLHDVGSLNWALESYGLRLVEEQHPVKVLIIKDNH